MENKELKKLGRGELLELLVEVSKERDELQDKLSKQEAQHDLEIGKLKYDYQTQINDLTQKLEDKTLAINSVGSIAEAALKVNGIFEAAQAAAEQYLENVRRQEDICRAMEKVAAEEIVAKKAKADEEINQHLTEAKAKAEQIVAVATVKAQILLEDAERKTNEYLDAFSKKIASFYTDHSDLQTILNGGNGERRIYEED